LDNRLLFLGVDVILYKYKGKIGGRERGRFQQLRLLDNPGSRKKLSIDEIIKKVCICENINIREITKRTRIQRISDIRKAMILLSEKYSSTSNSVIAQKLNLAP
jgi:hypothetical protein